MIGSTGLPWNAGASAACFGAFAGGVPQLSPERPARVRIAEAADPPSDSSKERRAVMTEDPHRRHPSEDRAASSWSMGDCLRVQEEAGPLWRSGWAPRPLPLKNRRLNWPFLRLDDRHPGRARRLHPCRQGRRRVWEDPNRRSPWCVPPECLPYRTALRPRYTFPRRRKSNRASHDRRG